MRIHRVALILLAFVALLVVCTPASRTVHKPLQFRTAVDVWRITAPAQSDTALIVVREAAVASQRAVEAQLTAFATAVARQAAEASEPLSFGLFPCIEQAESTNDQYDHSGLYGDLDSTWNGYDGYYCAGAAPLYVQNAFNLALYNRDGWRPWNDYCTGTT